MAITLKIDNPDIEEQLLQFLKQQKQDLEEVTIETLQFLLNAFQKKERISKYKKIEDELNGFQELSNVSLEKIWNNKEDEVYDRFLR